jgi:hypothetical protein
MFPLTAYSPEGKDCSILPGVADVSCMGANASSTAAYPDTSPLRQAASASTTTTPFHKPNMRTRRTCLRGSMDSNTFPSGGTEFSADFFCLTGLLHPDTTSTTDFQTIFRTTTFLFKYLSLLSVSHHPLGLCCVVDRPRTFTSLQYCIPSVTLPQMNRNSAACLCHC